MPLTAELRAQIEMTHTNTHDLGGAVHKPMLSKVMQLSTGTGLMQADLAFEDTRTLAASASENLDLNGALQDVFGATFNALKLVAVMVTASEANTNSVIVGGAATNAVPLFGGTLGTIAIPPGGVFMAACAGVSGLCTVTPATGDLLRVLNGGAGTTVEYTVTVIARSV